MKSQATHRSGSPASTPIKTSGKTGASRPTTPGPGQEPKLHQQARKGNRVFRAICKLVKPKAKNRTRQDSQTNSVPSASFSDSRESVSATNTVAVTVGKEQLDHLRAQLSNIRQAFNGVSESLRIHGGLKMSGKTVEHLDGYTAASNTLNKLDHFADAIDSASDTSPEAMLNACGDYLEAISQLQTHMEQLQSATEAVIGGKTAVAQRLRELTGSVSGHVKATVAAIAQIKAAQAD